MAPKTLDQILGQSTSSKKGVEPIRQLTKVHTDKILALITSKNQIKLDQEALREDTKAIAEELGLKTGDINRIMTIVSQEQEKGGAINDVENVLSLANQVLGRVDEKASGSE